MVSLQNFTVTIQLVLIACNFLVLFLVIRMLIKRDQLRHLPLVVKISLIFYFLILPLDIIVVVVGYSHDGLDKLDFYFYMVNAATWAYLSNHWLFTWQYL